MPRLPDWMYEEYKSMILAAVADLAAAARATPGDAGPWTARICRYINGLPETEPSVIHCGLCAHYANPRKRARAARLPETLPGFEAGAYQLHATCAKLPFRRLITLLHSLQQNELVWSESGRKIPDRRNHRQWDFATVWWPLE